jgi:hypothetical protein
VKRRAEGAGVLVELGARVHEHGRRHQDAPALDAELAQLDVVDDLTDGIDDRRSQPQRLLDARPDERVVAVAHRRPDLRRRPRVLGEQAQKP